MKRSRLNRRSKRKQAIMDAARDTLERFAEDHPYCWACGSYEHPTPPPAELHHIAGRGTAEHEERENLSAFCDECHRYIHGHRKTTWPIVLAYKKARDGEHYDRVKVLELAGFAETYVTEPEVDAALYTT